MGPATPSFRLQCLIVWFWIAVPISSRVLQPLVSYDAIIFDLDGVLITGAGTPDGVYRDATVSMMQAFGRDDLSTWPEALENPDSGESFRRACEQVGVPGEPAWGYRERAATVYEASFIDRGERTSYPDTDVIQRLSEGYRLGIASNNRHETVAYCLDRFDWNSEFERFRGRFPTLEDYDRMKPDPSYLTWVIDRLQARDPLFVGDRATDVLAADRAGADAAYLERSGEGAPDQIEPSYVVHSLSELVDLHEAGWPESERD